MKREKTLLHQIVQTLKEHSETPALDAQTLLSHITQKPRPWVLAHPELNLSPQQEKKLDAALTQLLQNIPLPYVIGQWEFFGLNFLLTPDVLIPRPETEELVEMALEWLHDKDDARVLDMGTGSGCIPIALARNAGDLHLLGVDRSSAALNIARQNAAKHGVVNQIDFVQSDLFSNLEPATFNLITANLPYIPSETLKTLDVYTREPILALDGGMDGLDLIRRFLKDAPRFLVPQGMILLEIDSSHGQKALETATAFFPEATCELLQDLSGRDRFIRIET